MQNMHTYRGASETRLYLGLSESQLHKSLRPLDLQTVQYDTSGN